MISNKLRYIFTPVIAAAALLWGCDSADRPCDTPDAGEGQASAILFRGSSQGLTRAVGDFPNNTIGVTATYAGSTDWRQYDDIGNEPVSVSSESGGIYYFTWQTVKYWPLDGTALNFAAYSPHTSESSAISLANDYTSLEIELQKGMPDILYATVNSEARSWTKSDGTVDLGTFNHALSQLTVNVAGAQTFNPGITIESLAVKTSRGVAILDLLAGDDNLTFIVAPDYSYDLVSSTTSFSQADPFTSTVFLFPGTEEQTEIIIKLRDSTFTFTGTYKLSDIPFDDDDSQTLTLVRAANTVVNLVVRSTTIQNPDDNITLQGQLTDWIDMGDLEVTIN
ncbi:MAG: fimbrillin family protein [Alistipes sp.]|nr:fimbrillin family protein [Alistipes sp.]